MSTSPFVKIAVLAAACCAAAPAAGQGFVDGPARTVEISPFGGFLWSSSVTATAGTVSFRPSWDVGLTLGFPVDERSVVEILYLYGRPDAQFATRSASWSSSPWFPVTSQYLQIGGTTAFATTERLEPFLAGGLGVAWFSPSSFVSGSQATIQPADTWLFAWHLGLGVKWWLSSRVGLRLEARVLMPTYFSSGTFLSGPNGAALTVNAGIPFVQGDLALAVVLAP